MNDESRPVELAGTHEGRPRVWTVFVAGLFAMPACGLLATAAAWLGRSDSSRLLIAMLVGEALLGLLVLYEGGRSTTPLRERLALRAPRLRWWAWPLLAAATLGVRTLSLLVVGALTGPPSEALMESLQALADMRGGLAIVAVLGLSLLPGFSEELLFRGYVQTRLVQRWGAPVAIGVAGLLFAAAHGDPVYAAMVLPIGLWLGAVAWWTGSTIASMVCHAANNAVLLAGAVLLVGDEAPPAAEMPDLSDPKTAGAFALSLVVVVGASLLVWKRGRIEEPGATGE